MPVDRPTGGDRPHEIGDPERQLVADSQDQPRPVRDPLDSDAAKRLGEVRNAADADDPGDVEVRPSSPDRPPPPERQSTWWREHQDAERADDVPFDLEQARRVPDFDKSQGTEGMLVDRDGSPLWDEVHSNKDRPRASYEVGWQELRLPLKDPTIMDHLEASVAAEMRKSGLDRATLYLNREPCPNDTGARLEDRPITCDPMLPRMLPPGAELDVYAPNGFYKRYVGLEDS